MTKISRLPLRNDVWDRVFRLFIDTISDLKNKKDIENFINDFFSPTEKIMFSKRLATSVLLAKGHDYESIRKILRISPPTIAKLSIKVKFASGGLKKVVVGILQKQNAQVLWKEIEELFDLPTKGSYKSPERFKRGLERKRKVSELKSEF